MKHLLLTTIAAMLVVGCGESQQSATPAEAQPVEPVAEAVVAGNIEAVKQAIASGADVNAKDVGGRTPLHLAASRGLKEVIELLIAKGADVNAKDNQGRTPLDVAIEFKHTETAELLRKHGGKTAEELKAEGK